MRALRPLRSSSGEGHSSGDAFGVADRRCQPSMLTIERKARKDRQEHPTRVGEPERLALQAIQQSIVSCERCPRLREYCAEIARTKRRAYRNEGYWGKPVPGFGDPSPRILLVALAPAAHVANRTGRVFTGHGPHGSGDCPMAAPQPAGF